MSDGLVVEHDGEEVPESEITALRKEIGDLTDALDRRSTRGLILVGILVLAVVACAFASLKAITASDDAKDAVARTNQVVDENKRFVIELDQAREETALVGCQNRNSGQRGVRDAFNIVLNLIIANDPTPSQGLIDLADQINSALAATPDRDCDGDGQVGAGDYLNET